MIGLAAQRKPNGDLVVVSPKDGIEFDINEDLLNINMIELGKFCRVGVKNNVPVSYSLLKDEEIGSLRILKIQVDGSGSVEVSNVTGVLISKLALIYQTEEFGDIACKDETEGKIGTKHKLLISRLPENQRTGVYSKFVWQGVSDRLFKSSSNTNSCEEVPSTNDEDSGSVERDKENDSRRAASTPRPILPRYITGFVTGLKPSNNTSYIACNLTYPGVDGKIYCTKNNRLSIGDWVEVRFSESDFARFFPPNPTSETPRFSFTTFKKVAKPANYSVRMTEKGPEVKIKDFRLSAGHKKGDDIEDRFLGTVSDGNKLISGSDRSVDLIVRRRKVFETKNKNLTTWFIKKSKKSVARSESTESERSSSVESRKSKEEVMSQKRSDKTAKGRSGKFEKDLSKGAQSQTSQHNLKGMKPVASTMNWQMRSPAGMVPVAAMPPFVPMPPLFFPAPYGTRSPMTNPTSQQPVRKGFNKAMENTEKLVSKRAVVTSVKPNKKKQNGKDTIAFLWLLDDHVSSVYYFSTVREPDTTPGHFFEGSFFDTGERWECVKYVKSLGKLMDGFIKNGSIELQITVYQYFPQSHERLNAETHHSFIGNIIDRYNILPKDCSSGVKVSIKVSRLEERNDYCWVVCRVHQSKRIQLLAEIHQAWQKPGIRDAIRLKCPQPFGDLFELLDSASEGQISHAHNQWKNSQKPSSTDHQETTSSKKFAWVTVQDGDFIRMVVFPRVDGQKMTDMKKHVTDKRVYENVERMQVQKLYSVQIDDKGEVVAMFDCPQYFFAKSNGEIEFKVISCNQILLARNVALVEAIGIPEWVGKLMFCPDRPISKNKVLMKASFRFLEDKDLFADDEIVCDEGVCFVNIGPPEKLRSQSLEGVLRDERSDIDRKIIMHGQNLFKTRLECISNEIIISHFKSVCRILGNKDIIEAMKEQNIDTDKLIRLRSSAQE